MRSARGIGAIVAGVMLLLGLSGNWWALYHIVKALLVVVN
jgi:hypothetical protein